MGATPAPLTSPASLGARHAEPERHGGTQQADRRLLTHALAGDLETLRSALDAQVRVEQAKDRAYWEPLRRELEVFGREEMLNREIRTD